jgi:hypothetical protein
MPKALVKKIPLGFDKNVFINCPFDDKYQLLFRAIIFTVHDMGRVVIQSGMEILTRFRKFKRALPSICFRLHWDPDRLGFVDYAYAVASRISANPP